MILKLRWGWIVYGKKNSGHFGPDYCQQVLNITDYRIASEELLLNEEWEPRSIQPTEVGGRGPWQMTFNHDFSC